MADKDEKRVVRSDNIRVIVERGPTVRDLCLVIGQLDSVGVRLYRENRDR